MKIAVIGAGSWGTTLANVAANNGHRTVLWAYEKHVAETINSVHRNDDFLGGISLNESLLATNDLRTAAADADIILLVCPSHVMRTICEELRDIVTECSKLVIASKGLEIETHFRMSLVVVDVLGPEFRQSLTVLSGPSFADEVARGLPTVVTAASLSPDSSGLVQDSFSNSYLRVYTHDDIIGVELGGAIKNVIAIATGIVDGMGLGYNTRAALITRAIAEITRLGVELGASSETFSGISGIGDLILTCTGDLSRNRSVGMRIGKGESLEQIRSGMKTVAEGINTTKSAYELSRIHGVEMPITEQVYRILFDGHSVKEAVRELMSRDLKGEYGQ